MQTAGWVLVEMAIIAKMGMAGLSEEDCPHGDRPMSLVLTALSSGPVLAGIFFRPRPQSLKQ